MAKTVTIPTSSNPFIVEINGVKYSYAAGSTQTVPDAVAEAIQHYVDAMPKEAPIPGKAGQYVRRKSDATATAQDYTEYNNVSEVPTTGTSGQFLEKTSSGCAFSNLPDATASAKGIVKMCSTVSDADADTIVTQFNALLTVLKSAGIMVTPSN